MLSWFPLTLLAQKLYGPLSGAEGEWRQVLEREESGCGSVIVGEEVPADNSRAVDDDDIRATGMLTSGDDGQHVEVVNLQPRLLAAFANGSLFRAFVVIHKTRRQAPKPLLRLPGTAHKQDAPCRVLDDNPCGDFMITEDDKAAGWADAAHLAEGQGIFESMATAWAVVQFNFL